MRRVSPVAKEIAKEKGWNVVRRKDQTKLGHRVYSLQKIIVGFHIKMNSFCPAITLESKEVPDFDENTVVVKMAAGDANLYGDS